MNNIKILKKHYSSPKMSVLEMCGKVSLLADSMTDAPDEDDGVLDYNGELGFIFKDSDRKV